jgi:hypothetical protein
MDIARPGGLRIFHHVFPSILIATMWDTSSMCIKPLRNIVPENLHTRISSPHSNYLRIHAPLLDEEMLTTNTLGDLTHSSTTCKCKEIVGTNLK